MFDEYKDNIDQSLSENQLELMSGQPIITEDGQLFLNEIHNCLQELISTNDVNKINVIATLFEEYNGDKSVIFQDCQLQNTFEEYLQNISDDFEKLKYLYDVLIDVLTHNPEFRELFLETSLFPMSLQLATNEDDTLASYAIMIIEPLLNSMKSNQILEYLEDIYGAIKISWNINAGTRESVSKILLILNNTLGQNDLHDLSIRRACKLLNNDNSFDVFLNCIKLLTKKIKIQKDLHHKIIDSDIPKIVKHQLRRFLNKPSDFEGNAKNDLMISILDFALISNELAAPFTVIELSYSFIKYCMKELDFNVVQKALDYLTFLIYQEDEKLCTKVLQDNVIQELFDYILSESFKLKISALKLVHSILKINISRKIYDLLIQKEFIQNQSEILEDETDEKSVLLFLECIYMMLQAGRNFNDEESIPFALEECGAMDYLMDLTDHDNDDVAEHSAELLDIFEQINGNQE
ncbi:hypothetical protein TVAG_294850 [Trichomonas vaginalis G3]|uniref:Uncharacterized protein n=1 Tax=Trichomonas vaginalis (strain ATCC PRA-98 / G3) TaxID=412133 RepID=A2DL43_TRIV3|nr:importin alpha family [Trichomonas vaginalis G3]EAY18834.1 hypothetical protein TVAG_294850 [Trichomonas vaginalis G3]KAI5526060.1 importin alpha family [Trichomonas vaginalis G3]|eukprot:XP_001579820.1 hypothetical protein [Trichomonas vaginalis G3]